MSTFAVAAFHDAQVPVGTAQLDAIVWIRAAEIAEPGVNVVLRVWTPRGVSLSALRELGSSASDDDLLGRAIAIDERTVDVPAGRWSAGVREYELALALPERDAGDELLAARVGVVAGGEIVRGAQIVVTWCEQTAARAPAGAGADLPTGPSRGPRDAVGDAAPGEPCPGCGLPRDEDDAFCEGCGRDLAAGDQKSRGVTEP